jgi:succinate dehydrogenase/fumarate reductase flavoprotein subunit
MGLPKSTVVSSLRAYQKDATKGTDKFGKTTFRGLPAKDLETEVFYAGTVTPVLHYCMGGISIDKEGNVLNARGEIIPGLHAVGEVSGGVHGVNRLAGNSLLECTVYGTIVGKKIPIRQSSFSSSYTADEPISTSSPSEKKERQKITESELSKHNTPDDCWVAIHGVVYDLTAFADEHPAGAASIHELAGQDGTEAFAAVHNARMLEDFDEEIMGEYAS